MFSLSIFLVSFIPDVDIIVEKVFLLKLHISHLLILTKETTTCLFIA